MYDQDRIQQRRAEQHRRRPGWRRWHTLVADAPVAEVDVAAFERLYGVRLPESYRAFLLEVGLGRDCGAYLSTLAEIQGELVMERPGFIQAPFPHTVSWNATDLSEDDYFDSRWIEGSVAISEGGCGYYDRLVVTGAARGQVWVDLRAADGGLEAGPDFFDWFWRPRHY
jgi:hypothetical protein